MTSKPHLTTSTSLPVKQRGFNTPDSQSAPITNGHSELSPVLIPVVLTSRAGSMNVETARARERLALEMPTSERRPAAVSPNRANAPMRRSQIETGSQISALTEALAKQKDSAEGSSSVNHRAGVPEGTVRSGHCR